MAAFVIYPTNRRSLLLTFIVIVFAVFFMGCAHTQTPTYTLPQHLADRMIRIGNEVSACIQPQTDLEYRISNDQEPNAWVTEDGPLCQYK